jgi:proteasome regulatory subunit
MSPTERLDALNDHFESIVQVHEQLSTQLDSARDRRSDLRDQVDLLQRENDTLKTSSLYLATVEEIADGEAILKQHGNNQEVLTEVGGQMGHQLEAGDRVGINDSFAVQTVLESETDARAQAMEVVESPEVAYADIGGLAEQTREVREAVEAPLLDPERFETVRIAPTQGQRERSGRVLFGEVLGHEPPGEAGRTPHNDVVLSIGVGHVSMSVSMR